MFKEINQLDWYNIARENQKIPCGDWKIWLILAGRGFGKTRTAAESVRKFVLEQSCKRIALIGNTITEAEKVMIEGESGILEISRKEDGIKYLRSQKKLVWKNGACAFLYGADEYDKLRGPQFDFAWIDEFAKFRYAKNTFDQLNFALRLGKNPRTIITTTPRPIKILQDIMAKSYTHITRGSSLENLQNLPTSFIEQLEYLKGTSLEAQEIYGEIVSDNSDELWNLDDMHLYYKTPQCLIEKIVIAVDPAVSSKENSDETGIIVCGKDEIGNTFVLDDLSTKDPSSCWENNLINAYYKYKAECIIVEANQGGDLVKNSLLEKDKTLNIKNVYARENKKMRAIPISNLYKKCKVFHVKQFQKLEMQMSSFVSSKKSPDRVDALVWGITELQKTTYSYEQNNVSYIVTVK